MLIVQGISHDDIIQTALREEGYDTVLEVDAARAVESAQEMRPDLVIFSWRMAGMDGPEFLEAIRAAGVEAPALMCSAWTEAADVAAELGVPFVPKPFDLDHLYDAVRDALREV